MKIIYDFKRKARWLYESDSLYFFLRALFSDASLCMLLYRIINFLNNYIITKPLAIIFSKINSIVCGAVIGRGASFGNGFIILHSIGIVINKNVIGGENIIIESGVVIGEEKRRCPILGSNIFVGSGAKIFGNITIGDNVTIGANAVVNKSVPDNVVIAGVPARIVRRK